MDPDANLRALRAALQATPDCAPLRRQPAATLSAYGRRDEAEA